MRAQMQTEQKKQNAQLWNKSMRWDNYKCKNVKCKPGGLS